MDRATLARVYQQQFNDLARMLQQDTIQSNTDNSFVKQEKVEADFVSSE